MTVPIAFEVPDVEQILIDAIRDNLSLPEQAAAWDSPEIGPTEPAPRTDGLMIVVRLDDVSPVDVGLYAATVGVKLVGPKTDLLGKVTGQVARTVHGLLRSSCTPRSGLAGVTNQNGPYRLTGTDTDRPEWYQTAEIRVVPIP